MWRLAIALLSLGLSPLDAYRRLSENGNEEQFGNLQINQNEVSSSEDQQPSEADENLARFQPGATPTSSLAPEPSYQSPLEATSDPLHKRRSQPSLKQNYEAMHEATPQPTSELPLNAKKKHGKWKRYFKRLSGDKGAANPDARADMVQIVRKHGYPIETHHIATEDGYILTAFRIPQGVAVLEPTPVKPVVLLQHALLCSSFDFVTMHPHQSLGFVLADAGFDVWFGNNRGNTYSRNHTTFPVDSDQFWNFTYDQMALYDLPALVEYALAATGRLSLTYVGHSQGTLIGFAGFSVNQTLASKIDLFVAMAPVAYARHQKCPVFTFTAKLHLMSLFRIFGMRDFMTAEAHGRSFLNRIASTFCTPLDKLCNSAISLFCGKSKAIDSARLEVILSHTPAGTSVKNLIHWSQGVQHTKFQMYDYGSGKKNMAAYGQLTPPAYNLTQVKVKVALFAGGKDILSRKEDIQYIVDSVPNLVFHKTIDDYAHVDFAWGVDANAKVYADLIKLLLEHAG